MENGEVLKIGKEKVANATTYMPEAIKEALSTQIAESCIYDMGSNGKDFKEFVVLPDVKGENISLKNALLLQILLNYYLKIEFKGDNIITEYDKYASGHILNQLERMKSDSEIKEKIFDILSDFKEFKRYVDVKIYDLKTKHNDPTERLIKAISLIIANPDFVKNMGEDLKTTIEQIKQLKYPEKENKQ